MAWGMNKLKSNVPYFKLFLIFSLMISKINLMTIIRSINYFRTKSTNLDMPRDIV